MTPATAREEVEALRRRNEELGRQVQELNRRIAELEELRDNAVFMSEMEQGL